MLVLLYGAQGGVYLITLWDGFAAYTSMLFGALCMVIAVSWFYGTQCFLFFLSRFCMQSYTDGYRR